MNASKRKAVGPAMPTAIEQRYLQLILTRHPGSRAVVARVLGIGERTLYRLLADLKVDPAASE